MDFANESYVRLYTRDTMTWKRFNWQAKAVVPLLLRKLDRSGVLELAGLEPAEAVALAIELPLEVVAEAMPVLFKLEVVEVHGDVLVEPKFIEAQECIKSDKLRAKEYRVRRRSQAMGEPSQNVTDESRPVTEASREITERHAASRRVTLNSAVLGSALHGSAVQLAPVAVSSAERVGRAWYRDLTEKLDPELPSFPAAYEFIGRQSAEERATVAANLRASSVHSSLKARRALSPKRLVDNLWQSHLLSEAEHAAQKAQYARQPAAAPPLAAHQLMKF